MNSVGFSIKSLILPTSSAKITPYLDGSSTSFTKIVL